MPDQWKRPDRPPTRDEKLQAAKRELGYRKRVYERRVDDKRMSAEAAGREIWLMEAIVADYENSMDGRLL